MIMMPLSISITEGVAFGVDGLLYLFAAVFIGRYAVLR